MLIDFFAILHFLGLAMGVGTGFAMFTLGFATRHLAPSERAAFMLRATALSRMGSIGLLLLIVSGLGMMWQRGVDVVFAWGGGLFHVKLTLVVVLLGVVGYMHALTARAKREGGGPIMAKLAIFGQLTLLVGITIVVVAVLAFR
jgi:uncharacterized membrane protein